MRQFLADHIDQLDLALDQLAMRDRNFDRFALMLIDNVVELTLHQYAKDKSYENEMFARQDAAPPIETKSVAAALGPHFDSKVKLAKETGLISDYLAESLQYLHAFRNTAYHSGLRHEGVLHSLSLFYFNSVCTVLASYTPMWLLSSSKDQISHRALKYLGKAKISDVNAAFEAAWRRLREVSESMGETLVQDLHCDMTVTIDRVDEEIDFLADESPGGKNSRKQVIVECQAWPFAFSEKGKAYARSHQVPLSPCAEYVSWIAATYPWPTRTDPIPGWRKRLHSLGNEENPHLALKKYCQFMSQTLGLRTLISESASQLDAHIQQMVDAARGK